MKKGKAHKEAQKLLGGIPKEDVRQHELNAQRGVAVRFRHKISMFCLSEICNDILMWSHYADGHRGICLVFDGKNDKYQRFRQKTACVAYKDSIPEFNFYRDTDERKNARAMMLTKATDWSYEKEWRFINIEGGPGLYHIPPGIISGVILGAKMEEDDKARVTKLVRGLGRDISLQEAVLNDRTYALDIRPVQP